ncbi:MAG: class I SAM-dependent methyltransferase [Planctomycetota bacterium]|nr:class I SAM-dependent methyltransferase [Planctomycetota bacterium]
MNSDSYPVVTALFSSRAEKRATTRFDCRHKSHQYGLDTVFSQTAGSFTMEFDSACEIIRRTRKIEGWFWPAAAHLFALLDEIQKSVGIEGNIFEIGAYHGKSAVLLCAMLRGNAESLGVCDRFGCSSDRNVAGFRPQFDRTMRNHSSAGSCLRVLQKDSADLTPEETTTNCRFFHIDGGHGGREVYDDLVVASKAVGPNGLVVLDDFHNSAWPGVAEGFFRFMHERPGEFVPLAVGFNKGVLTRPSAHGLYRRFLNDPARCWAAIPRGPFSVKTIEFCGVDTVLFHTPSHRSPDLRRSILSIVHQHRPRFADALGRVLRYHRSRTA